MSETVRLIIALDNGKMNLKAKCGKHEIIYRNRYTKKHTADIKLLGDNTFNVTYKNQQYTVGANARYSDKNEGKSSDEQVVQALTAATRFIDEDNNKPIVLLYGESIDMYFDADHKRELREKLIGDHTIEVVNGHESKIYKFTIDEVIILPEGLGDILSDFANKMGVQYVVDIGGGTISFLKVFNGVPQMEESRSFPLGVNNIVSKLQTALKRKGFGEVDETLALQYIVDRPTSANIVVNKTIDELVSEQFEDFDNRLAAMGTNIHNILKMQKVTFIGGGAELFKTQIAARYRCDVSTDPLVVDDSVFANVRGFYNYALLKEL